MKTGGESERWEMSRGKRTKREQTQNWGQIEQYSLWRFYAEAGLLKTNQREVKQRTEKGSYPSPFSTFRAVCIRESEVRSQKIIRVGVKRMSSGLYCGEIACPPSVMSSACPRSSMPRWFQGETHYSIVTDPMP